jgi:hypothetical protein
MSDPISFSSEEKLNALHEVDIFHNWDSLDERRLCRRCGQIISGRDIKVVGSRQSHGGVRLECPTPGCLSVPIEWLMLEPPTDVATEPLKEDPEPQIARRQILEMARQLLRIGGSSDSPGSIS